MLIDTGATIAYKCSSCGAFKFFSISLFKLLYKNENILSCHCGKSNIMITKSKAKEYKIAIPCIGCGSMHVFRLDIKDILYKNDINVLNCPESGMKLCFIGGDEEVRGKVDSFENELDKLIDMFGYDSYFKNTQVMFDALNKIHDIAEQGNLQCQCGNSDIDLLLLSDKILLKCRNCDSNRIVYAASNGELKDSLPGNQLILPDGGKRKSQV